MSNSLTAPTCRAARATSRWLDEVERGVLLFLFGWLVYRILAVYAVKGAVTDLILLPSEGLVLLLILLRRRTDDVSRRPVDWSLAFLATLSPLLAQASMAPALVAPAIGAVLIVMGMVVQIHAKLVLGRSFGLVAANRGLKIAGPYRFVRHPMYAGYFISHCGFLLMNPTAWNLGVYSLCYALQVPRLLAEERLLRTDRRYLEYMANVRYRLIPGMF